MLDNEDDDVTLFGWDDEAAWRARELSSVSSRQPAGVSSHGAGAQVDEAQRAFRRLQGAGELRDEQELTLKHHACRRAGGGDLGDDGPFVWKPEEGWLGQLRLTGESLTGLNESRDDEPSRFVPVASQVLCREEQDAIRQLEPRSDSQRSGRTHEVPTDSQRRGVSKRKRGTSSSASSAAVDAGRQARPGRL